MTSEAMIAECEDCHRPYGDGGFPDLIIPYWAWKKISTHGDETGLLCPSCICGRLEASGMKGVPAAIMSGDAIRSVTYDTMATLRGLENIELAIDGRNNAMRAIRNMVPESS